MTSYDVSVCDFCGYELRIKSRDTTSECARHIVTVYDIAGDYIEIASCATCYEASMRDLRDLSRKLIKTISKFIEKRSVKK